MQSKVRWEICPDFYLGLAIALLLFPPGWIIAWAVASAVHELSHYIALRCCSVPVKYIRIGLNGTVMEIEQLQPGKEWICALAGPVGGALLLLTARWTPLLALFGCIQSVYNLLPLFPLDGGRAMRCVFQYLFPTAADRVSGFVESLFLIILAILALYASVKLLLGPLPLVAVALLLWKNGKIPCKAAKNAVQ